MTSLVDLHCTLKVWPRRLPQPLSWTQHWHTTFLLGSAGHKHTSRGQSPVCYREGPCSIPEQSICDLWRTSWHCRRFVTEYCCFPLSVSFHHVSQSVLRPVPGDPWIHLCILFEVYLFFNYRNYILSTVIAELLYLTMCLFHVTVRISNYETPCTHEAETVSLIKARSYNNSYVCCWYVFVSIYYQFGVINSFWCLLSRHSYFREQKCENPWLFLRSQKGIREQNSLGNTVMIYTSCIRLFGTRVFSRLRFCPLPFT